MTCFRTAQPGTDVARRAFERDLDRLFQAPARSVGLLHVDLDRFEWVNDTLGHQAGDQVLRTAASHIQEVINPFGLAYRVGGDEFMIILGQNITNERANWIGGRIVETMAAPMRFGQQRTGAWYRMHCRRGGNTGGH